MWPDCLYGGKDTNFPITIMDDPRSVIHVKTCHVGYNVEGLIAAYKKVQPSLSEQRHS
jgi:hypothetical protein